MIFAAGISVVSLTRGSVIKAKVLSHEDETYSRPFEVPITVDVKHALQHLTKLFSEQCGEIKYTTLCIPAYASDGDREMVKTAADEELAIVRITRNTNLVHTNSLTVREHPLQNHIAIEIGANDAIGRLVVVEAEDGIVFYSNEYEDATVREMGAVEPTWLFDHILQPLLDRLASKPTECGSEVQKVVVVDSSLHTEHPTLAFRLFGLIREKFQLHEYRTELVYDDKFLDYAADVARRLYKESLEPFNGCIFNVLPFNIGIAKADGFMHTILRRNRTIPTKMQDYFTTSKDNQTRVTLRVVFGFARRVADSMLACEFVLEGLTEQPQGEALIRVTIDVDANDEMSVVAEEVGANFLPPMNGATASVRMNTFSGEANVDGRKIEQLYQAIEKQGL